MKVPIYQVDAFAESVFQGNPAAVCPLEQWLDDKVMQQIAGENNLAETAFLVKDGDTYQIRWFTPAVEVDLCGHATLASAYVIFNYLDPGAKKVAFHSPRSGALYVSRSGNGYLELDFPADTVREVSPQMTIVEALGKTPLKTFKGKTDYLLIYENQKYIEKLQPNFFLLEKANARGVIVSAPGEEVDFVSRFFAPQSGIAEDPVTGSAHTTLIPYWAQRLKKNQLTARQLSKRGGYLKCTYEGERVKIAGKAVPYMKGEIDL
jgi:PhzF family phenazine biosynthesis protein